MLDSPFIFYFRKPTFSLHPLAPEIRSRISVKSVVPSNVQKGGCNPHIMDKNFKFESSAKTHFLVIIQGFTSEMHILEGTAELTEIKRDRISGARRAEAKVGL